MKPPITEEQAWAALAEIYGWTKDSVRNTQTVVEIGKERDAWRTAHDEQVAKLTEIANELDDCRRINHMERDRAHRLIAEIDALKIDAERYRWLRDVAGNKIMRRLENILESELWNAAIDAAMGESS